MFTYLTRVYEESAVFNTATAAAEHAQRLTPATGRWAVASIDKQNRDRSIDRGFQAAVFDAQDGWLGYVGE